MENENDKKNNEKSGQENAPEQAEQHEKEISELRKMSEEYKDTLQRLQADFENFRKRLDREKAEFREFAGMKVVEDFLPLMDSLGEGQKEARKGNNAQMAGGFEKIIAQLKKILESHGVRKIESVGKKFDLGMHESLMVGKDEKQNDDVVLEEFQKGYTMNGKVLRPAKVKVNKRE